MDVRLLNAFVVWVHAGGTPKVVVRQRQSVHHIELLKGGADYQRAIHQGLSHVGLLALVALQNGEAAPSHIAGTQNFFAVTRYNHSAYYALAVIELGQAVAATRSPTK
jgi:membrane-bound lytic murein transglycosylase B